MQTVGPYRLLERLGAGGMGEVFLAYDDRLDRRVAIKRIRSDAGISPERRERFRREARMTARLSHPAIVQIFDILQENDTDSIVMEYVEGTNLRALVDGGPLDPAKVVELARELADGLEAAHRSGIVHRDLKSENVLVGPAGRPKVTDFGVAKHLLAEEESLTGDHKLIGTCRSMSPEQARGEPVDHRTDLFAMGVLLYEMLTGRSPFAAENPLATITRVLHHRQPPVRELVPAVPEDLSKLVDRLLEKDASLRPRNAGQVRRELERLALTLTGAGGTETVLEIVPSTSGRAQERTPTGETVELTPPSSAAPQASPARRSLAALVALAILAGLAIPTYLALRPAKPPLYVAVLAPEVGAGAGNGETDLLASGVRVALLQGLVSLQGISPKAFSEVDTVLGSPREVARALAADEALGTRLDCRPETCRLSLSRHDEAGDVLWAESLEIPTDDFALVTRMVIGSVTRSYARHRPRPKIPEIEVSSRDIAELWRLRQRFDTGQETSSAAVLAGLEEIRRRSPGFLDAYLLAATVARVRFHESRNQKDLLLAFERVRQARELAPGSPEPLLIHADLALAARDLTLVEETLGQLESLIPGDVRLLDRRALLAEAKARPDDALTLARQAARLNPSSKRLYRLAQIEIQQGQVAPARQHLDALLERSPGDYNGLSLLATLELTYGDFERAASLYAELVRRSPGLIELSNLGLAYFALGRYPEAEAVFERLVAKEPAQPAFALNLADTYLLSGKVPAANALYERVISLIDADPTAKAPQTLTIKAQALAHLGRHTEAVAVAQEAIRLAPSHGPVLYEASLVYALAGEETSAFVNAREALRLGYEARWFSLPWFETVRQNPEFRALL